MLLFSSTQLAELAAEAARPDHKDRHATDRPTWRRVANTARLPEATISADGRAGCGLDQGDPRRLQLASLVEAAVAGSTGSTESTFTEDVRGWTPSFTFESRQEVQQALTAEGSTYTPVRFETGAMFWADPVLFAEWSVDAMVTEPILVADDLLVEAQGRPFTVAGALVAEVHQARFAQIHLYFDECTLVEQVVLDH